MPNRLTASVEGSGMATGGTQKGDKPVFTGNAISIALNVVVTVQGFEVPMLALLEHHAVIRRDIRRIQNRRKPAEKWGKQPAR